MKAKKTVFQFRKSIEDLDVVTKEKWKITRKFDVSAELNVSGKDVICGAAAGAIFDFYSNLCTVPLGAIAGAVAAIIRIKASATRAFEPSKEKQIFGYLANTHDEKILPR